MATYFQSLNIGTVSSDANHNATVSGTYGVEGSGDLQTPYGLALVQLDANGNQVGSPYTAFTSTPVVTNGSFTLTYDSSKFAIPAGNRLEVTTNDTASGNTIASAPLTATSDIDGYLAGATVFVDVNGNGVLDAGEYSAKTDAQGNVFLPVGTGQVISTGGTDILTGLAFNGTLTATAGASVITPITTLVNQVAKLNGGDVAAAQAAVSSALGLPAGTNLNALDPIAATQAGTSGASAALAASAEVINTAKLVAATGANGDFFAALATQIAQGGGPVDLTNPTTVTALATASGASSAAASAVGQIAAASNTAVAQAAASNAGNPTAILGAVTAITKVAQGSTVATVAAAGNDSTALAQAVASNTGGALTAAIAQAAASGSVVTGPSTNNSPSVDSQTLQDFLSNAFNTVGTVPVTFINGTGTGVTSSSLNAQIGVVSPGSNVALTVNDDAFLFASGGAKVDLSGSPRLNAAGDHLAVNVTLGSGANTVTLNHGPSSVQSTIGNDTLISGGGHDTLYGGSGQDSMLGGGHSRLFGGSVGGDTLRGGTSFGSHDTLFAGAGGDVLTTRFGHNLVIGNENDTVRAGFAQDTVFAGYGPETINGGLGSVVYGGGQSVMQGGRGDTYKATGADTIYGSNYDNAVVIQGQADGVTIDGRTGTGALDVTVGTTRQGNDTLFGGANADGTGSNLTIHVAQAFTEQQGLDANGLHVVQLAGGQTLHVTNVTIDFQDKKTYV